MKSLCEEVIDLLREKHFSLTTAESCTGGMIGASLVDVPGASDVYGYGFITYANEAKIDLVGVSSDTLAKVGAVSEDTAREMAIGAANKAHADLAVSVTGIAGPGGGRLEKPVGLVYIGVYNLGDVEVTEHHFSGTREEIRRLSAKTALQMILRALCG